MFIPPQYGAAPNPQEAAVATIACAQYLRDQEARTTRIVGQLVKDIDITELIESPRQRRVELVHPFRQLPMDSRSLAESGNAGDAIRLQEEKYGLEPGSLRKGARLGLDLQLLTDLAHVVDSATSSWNRDPELLIRTALAGNVGGFINSPFLTAVQAIGCQLRAGNQSAQGHIESLAGPLTEAYVSLLPPGPPGNLQSASAKKKRAEVSLDLVHILLKSGSRMKRADAYRIAVQIGVLFEFEEKSDCEAMIRRIQRRYERRKS